MPTRHTTGQFGDTLPSQLLDGAKIVGPILQSTV